MRTDWWERVEMRGHWRLGTTINQASIDQYYYIEEQPCHCGLVPNSNEKKRINSSGTRVCIAGPRMKIEVVTVTDGSRYLAYPFLNLC